MSLPAYTLIGHVCVDEVAGGTRLGGTVHFSAGQARALGCAVRIITSATPELARRLFDEHDGEIALDLQQSELDTRFGFTADSDGGPVRLVSGADALDATAVAMQLAQGERGIVHLGPIANDFGPGVIELARKGSDYLGITPQGLLRTFAPDGSFRFEPTGWTDSVHLADSIVVNEGEYRALIDLGLLEGFAGLVFRTRGPDGATVSRAGVVLGERTPSLNGAVDPSHTIGAGDVFAAAAFIAHAAGESPADALEVAVELSCHYVHRAVDEPVFYGIDA